MRYTTPCAVRGRKEATCLKSNAPEVPLVRLAIFLLHFNNDACSAVSQQGIRSPILACKVSRARLADISLAQKAVRLTAGIFPAGGNHRGPMSRATSGKRPATCGTVYMQVHFDKANLGHTCRSKPIEKLQSLEGPAIQ
jgi:hypothetical protein